MVAGSAAKKAEDVLYVYDCVHALLRMGKEADVVALSFSAAFPVRQAGDGLATLRRQLPPRTALWAGGEMTRRIRKTLPGVTLIPDIAGTTDALQAWRAQARWPQPPCAAPEPKPAPRSGRSWARCDRS